MAHQWLSQNQKSCDQEKLTIYDIQYLGIRKKSGVYGIIDLH